MVESGTLFAAFPGDHDRVANVPMQKWKPTEDLDEIR
jgi:hypothetical protein